jgi:membrane protein DedA with SNARE-associated domain
MLGLVPTYGPLAVFVAALLGCFGVPVPGTLVLLAAGAFAASGEMAIGKVVTGGLAGAIVGDQAGYWLGAFGSDGAVQRLTRRRQVATGGRPGLYNSAGAAWVSLSVAGWSPHSVRRST